MKTIKFDYDEIGSVCLVDKADMDRLFAELPKLGVKVKTIRGFQRRRTPTAPDGLRVARSKKPAKKSFRPAKASRKPTRR